MTRMRASIWRRSACRRLRRYKHRIKDYHSGAEATPERGRRDYVIEAPTGDGEEDEPDDFTPVIIAESTTRMQQCFGERGGHPIST